MYLTFTDIGDPVKYVIDTILKEAKHEEKVSKQILVTILSSYSNDPINLELNAPSGVGKNYIINTVSSLCPPADIINLAGMTDKALFHRSGTLVIKNEKGEYVSIEEKVKALEDEIEDKECERKNTNDRNLKQGLKSIIDKLYKDKKELLKNAKKLINLEHKTLIFLDSPNERLLAGLLPLLSHDKYEVEYEYVDTHNGIKTHSNVLRGWPAVIMAHAVDFSHSKRYPEYQRRFIQSNPDMSKEKYEHASEHISLKNSVPDFVYQQQVVSEEEKNKARQIIAGLKEQIKDHFRDVKPESNNVIIPYGKSIADAIPTGKAEDMTRIKKFFTYLSFIPFIYIHKRPRIVIKISITDKETGQNIPAFQTIPIATFEDLETTLFLMEYSDGVRPYILKWYNEVFEEAYQDQGDTPDSKINNKGQELTENRVSVKTKNLIEKHEEVHGEKLTGKGILQNYIYPLLNHGYIDEEESLIDKRLKIYYPVIDTKKDKNFFLSDQKKNSLQEKTKIVVNISRFPSNAYIQQEIETVKKYSSPDNEIKIKNHLNQEITIQELTDQYFPNPEYYFTVRSDTPTQEKSKV